MHELSEQLRDGPLSVSVVVVNYNGGEAILDCLQSVQQHTRHLECSPAAEGKMGAGTDTAMEALPRPTQAAPAEAAPTQTARTQAAPIEASQPLSEGVEVLVVDNASEDGSPDAIKEEFPWVRLIQSGANIGFGAGNNLGVRHARGEYLVFLNPDTLVSDGWLDGLVGELMHGGGSSEANSREARSGDPGPADAGTGADGSGDAGSRDALNVRPEVGLVTSKILMADDPDIINTCGNSIHLTGITLCRGLGEPREAMSQNEDVSAASGAAFAMRREVFEKLGGFDEDMFLYMEDTDLSLRAQIAGYKCRYVPRSIVLHRYALKMTPMKVFYQERNRYLMLLKNLRWATLAALLPAALWAEVITWAFVALKDRANAGNKIRAYRWIWSNWKSIRRKRATVQSLRRAPDRAIVRSMSIRLDFGQAASPALALLAHIVFDPIFALFKFVALAIVWW
jgi:GT2 family glycosyltransferase